MGTHNIQEFGAKGDGKTTNTHAIQAAIDRCAEQGGGRVLVSPGRFVTGSLRLKSGTDLHLTAGAELVASVALKDFKRLPTPKVRSFCDRGGFFALLHAEGERDITLSGGGLIDGQGKHQQPRPGRHDRPDQNGRPRNVLLVSCQNVKVRDITLRNSGCWNQHYLDCEDLSIRGVTVFNHGNRNNDGMDIDSCRRVVVSDCNVDSDDDGICLKSNTRRPCEDITITGCVVASKCNAIKLGTESIGGFKNITISDCTIKGSSSPGKGAFDSPRGGWCGITINQMDGGQTESITIRDVTIDGPWVPFFIRLGKRGYTVRRSEKPKKGGVMRGIRVSNITAVTDCKWGCGILGSPGMPIEDLALRDIRISFPGGVKRAPKNVPEQPEAYPQANRWKTLPAYGLYIRHARNVTMDRLQLSCRQADSRPAVIEAGETSAARLTS